MKPCSCRPLIDKPQVLTKKTTRKQGTPRKELDHYSGVDTPTAHSHGSQAVLCTAHAHFALPGISILDGPRAQNLAIVMSKMKAPPASTRGPTGTGAALLPDAPGVKAGEAKKGRKYPLPLWGRIVFHPWAFCSDHAGMGWDVSGPAWSRTGSRKLGMVNLQGVVSQPLQGVMNLDPWHMFDSFEVDHVWISNATADCSVRKSPLPACGSYLEGFGYRVRSWAECILPSQVTASQAPALYTRRRTSHGLLVFSSPEPSFVASARRQAASARGLPSEKFSGFQSHSSVGKFEGDFYGRSACSPKNEKTRHDRAMMVLPALRDTSNASSVLCPLQAAWPIPGCSKFAPTRLLSWLPCGKHHFIVLQLVFFLFWSSFCFSRKRSSGVFLPKWRMQADRRSLAFSPCGHGS